MRVVTGCAILGDRCVLPEIGPAHFGMALVTGLIDRLPDHQLIGRVAVRAVTAAAIHLALRNGVRIRFMCLGARLLVAIETHFGLRNRRQDRIARSMTHMTVGTGDSVFIVTTAMPCKTRIVLMAVDALLILHFYRRNAAIAKLNQRRALGTTTDSCGMIATRTVAGLALQLAVTERRSRITRNGVFGTEHREGHLIVVTGETGVSAFSAVRDLVCIV